MGACRWSLAWAPCLAWMLCICRGPCWDGAQPAKAQAPAAGGAPADASPPARLFEDDPYDVIVLKEELQEVKVMPLDLPGRRLPINPKPTDKLQARLRENPVERYEITWNKIEEVRLFEQMVLADANKLVDAGKFDEAYDYFEYLRIYYRTTQGLDDGLANYFYRDAGGLFKQGQYSASLAILNELHKFNPAYAALPAAMGEATDKLAEDYEGKGDHPSARRLVQALRAKFPDQAIVLKWEGAWSGEAVEWRDRAQTALGRGEFRAAHQAITHALAVWPDVNGVRELAEKIYQAYPLVIVGVMSSASDGRVDRMIDWAIRRQNRLLHRTLFEYTGSGPEGGEYLCPVGTAEKVDIGRKLQIRLKKAVPWSLGNARLTGYDVARRLMDLGNPLRADRVLDWSDLFKAVDVRDVFEVDVDLRWSHPRPEAMLQIPLLPYGDAANAPQPEGSLSARELATVGPYRLAEQSAQESRFVANENYFAAGPTQPKEVVERYFPNGKAALLALRQGEVSMLDRVNPWDLERLRLQEDLVVGSYSVPTVHGLVVNPARPYGAIPSLRMAIAYGIKRDLILNKFLLHDKPIPGCQLLSGPFPAGLNADDPLGYAFNGDVPLRDYFPQLALTRAALALNSLKAQAKARGEAEPAALPVLTLAHPAHDIARVACGAIQKHLEIVKVNVKLRELPPGEWIPADADYDLLYMEFCVQEPLVEARRMLGPNGLAGTCSPYMGQALAQLDAASGWKQARNKLFQIHTVAADDVAIIPLWQLVDHFVYHKSLSSVGAHPVTLYQQVERWQCSMRLPEGTP